jgi:large subunit ribosomal protein L24
MKILVGDIVVVTAGKDKGKQGKVLKTYPDANKLTVEGANLYTRNYKPMAGQPGRSVKRERPLPIANVAIINDKGQPDRVGYSVSKTGEKTRIFKKTGSIIVNSKANETK